MSVISVGTFTKSILIEVAQNRGYLAESGISLNEISVPSSPAQFEMLERGEINVAITNPDNVLAYRYLKNNPLGRNLDVRIIGAIDRGLGLSLCYSPVLTSHPTSLGVDVPTSGFAFVGYELLAMKGIEFGSYKIKSLGSTPKRRVSLIEGKVDSTMLNAGNEIKATSQGAKQVASVSEIGSYLGTVLSTIGPPSGDVLKLREIINQVVAEILRGEHATLITNIAQRNLEISEAQATNHYRILLDPVHGLVPTGEVDLPSVRTLIELRKKYYPAVELDQIMDDFSSLVTPN